MSEARWISQPGKRQTLLSIVLIVCVAILTFLALVQPWALRISDPVVQVGDVAAQDINASGTIQYVSEVLTDEARDAAERSVAPVYAPADTSIAREQIVTLRGILNQISSIRANEELTTDEKRANLEGLEGITLTNRTITFLLITSDSNWDDIQNEALIVLERAMRNPIRSEGIEQARQNLPSHVSLARSEEEEAVVVDLVSPLVTANSFYSPDLTDAAREAARNTIQPVTRTYQSGETIVEGGEIISAADFEALTELGLIQQEGNQDKIIGAAAVVFVCFTFILLYFAQRRPFIKGDLRSLIIMAFLFLFFLILGRLIVPNRTIVPYLYPVPAFALLISVLFGMESGMVFSLLLSLLVAYGLPTALDLTPYYLLSSLCGVLALGQARRVGHFLWAAGAVAGAGAAVITAYRFPFMETDWVGIATLVGAAVINGIASTSLALLLQYILAQVLGFTTALQLLEISRLENSVLQNFLRQAPGTYQHSLQVVNLGEQAAERIGADALLTRVGAMYHDIGKCLNPLFFIENQAPNDIDSHDDMDPAVAAEIIIKHVTDGLALAKKNRLPRRIQDFISEHHGTLIARYQYKRALELAGGERNKVDVEKFRYPGPLPRSRETAIIMLADGVEARARAERPQTEEAILDLVRSVIESVQSENQLEDTPLTQSDIKAIAESFAETLRGTYHPRLEYPKQEVDLPSPS